jgi:predicted ATPase/class 3 adenylate cyclase
MESLTDTRVATIAFLFTDVEGSTALWEQHPQALQKTLACHDTLLRRVIARHGGHVYRTGGDAFCAAFSGAHGAVSAALAAQRALTTHRFSKIGCLKVRMALHAGEVELREGDYFGRAPNKTARLLASAHGGQVLVSGAVAELLSGRLPDGAALCDLGRHRLRDLTGPEQIYQLLGPGLANTFPPLRSLDALPNNLPQLPTPLIGRDREVVEIEALLTEHRLVTLIGAGGIGKTSLSLQVGADLLERFPDGVWLVELAPLDRAELVGEAIAALFGLPMQGGRSPVDAIAAVLRSKHLLLILDNCEHLVVAVARLADVLLKACPKVFLLTSSREALAMVGEHAYPMPLLDVPPRSAGLTAAQTIGYSAVRLFVERAASALGRFSLANETAPVIAEICRRLDGIPLAIELAAPRLKMLKPEDLLTRLDDRLRLLTSGTRTAAPRQQTLRALIEWSYALLSDAERALLRRLAVFAGSFTMAAVTAVAPDGPVEQTDVFDVMAGLVNKSLVVSLAGGSESRYRLLESTRAFALEKLASSAESHLPDRLCEYMAVVFERAERAWPATPTAAWLAVYEPDLDNLRAALGWSLRQDGSPALGLKLVGHTNWLWRELNLLQERRRWLELAATFINENTQLAVEARIHLALGWGAYFGDRSRLPHNLRAIALLRQPGGEPHLLGQALAQAGQSSSRYRDVGEAKCYLDEAYAILQRCGRTKPLANVLLYMATSRKHAGDVQGASTFVEEALGLSEALGDVWTSCACLAQRASIAFEAGELDTAIVHAGAAVETCHREGNLRSQFVALQWLAGFLLLDGRSDPGYLWAQEAFELSRTLGNVNLPDSLDQLALIAALRSDATRAARLAGYADAYAERYEITRYGIALAIRCKLLERLYADVTREECQALMAEGAAWSEQEAVAVAQAV